MKNLLWGEERERRGVERYHCGIRRVFGYMDSPSFPLEFLNELLGLEFLVFEWRLLSFFLFDCFHVLLYNFDNFEVGRLFCFRVDPFRNRRCLSLLHLFFFSFLNISAILFCCCVFAVFSCCWLGHLLLFPCFFCPVLRFHFEGFLLRRLSKAARESGSVLDVRDLIESL